ncbi:alpha/beta hydrolase [Paenibacillus sp. D2_2]|uniref:alpha/beta hydrolase n=1 Tax=Paenibacillus sp. D2_2 TaxID=3073092 RepID=UPI00281531B3|nr:alpha/beta hydrolase [Paenibacillus sp. D2_2]WMT43375.1 alpha/beta hydrolase [Paenibacillus sp. D2_2]
MQKDQVERYNAAGFHVFSIDYRLAPETRLTAIAEDILDALQWLQSHASAELGVEPSSIGVVGHSAGGYLALLAGAREPKLRAVVSFYGYGDILAVWATGASSHYLQKPLVPRTLADQLITGEVLTEASVQQRFGLYLYHRQQGTWVQEVTGLDPAWDLAELEALCPVEAVTAQYPPTLLLHGEQDNDVPCTESVRMAERLEHMGVAHTLITLPGEDHLFDMQKDKENVRHVLDKEIDFLRGHLL